MWPSASASFSADGLTLATGVFRQDGDGSVVLENGHVHIFDRCTTCSPDGGVKFVAGELGTHQNVWIQSPIVDQYFRTPFNESLKAFTAAGGDANKIVECHERQGGDEPPHQRVVSTIHRVLHSIRKHQQQNQIKRGELADLYFAC